MIVRHLNDIIDSERDVHAKNGNWESRRLILNNDAVGFSLHDTIIHAGTETLLWYKHHIEAVYCIEGEGEVETTDNGEVYKIKAGSVYLLNGNERHWLRARTTMRMVCVFNPPVTGSEKHDADGAYCPGAEAGS
ncbi:ectoine synthase [Mariprofundus ferrooxydans]|uniref:L-ectoine synthase n=1 Tax=Mariprofundus ferrooxydans PV-1 TaxID=314345 RepID=Q0EYM4_9PROT|nr:ectoine synthase [Mariprofundus ferrooxydans]EAU54343.1 ectoine synthase [Mariprofundus ferrooxydans PV-1]KON47433.1 L-ectoine synthase [Mariprofundus ferrooxydans]